MLAECAEEVLFVVEIPSPNPLRHAQNCLTDGARRTETYRVKGGGESTVRLLEERVAVAAGVRLPKV